MATNEKAYSEGERTALKAIANGVPRWFDISDRSDTQMIDLDTGLPIASLGAPAELADWENHFVKGHNDTISAALKSGEVTVDFRPLLMTRTEAAHALAENSLGIISADQTRIVAPNGEFSLELRFPRPTAKRKIVWIRYRLATGEQWPNFDIYDGPVEVAVGLGGRVLIFRTPFLIFTRDVITTQVLNRYRL